MLYTPAMYGKNRDALLQRIIAALKILIVLSVSNLHKGNSHVSPIRSCPKL